MLRLRRTPPGRLANDIFDEADIIAFITAAFYSSAVLLLVRRRTTCTTAVDVVVVKLMAT